jgi:hypothetical protein
MDWRTTAADKKEIREVLDKMDEGQFKANWNSY